MASPGSLEYGIRPPEYRLPDATRLGMVRLQVGDLQRSLGFYVGVLGFSVLETGGAGAIVGAGRTPLVELRARPGVRAVPRSGLLGLYHFAILLPNRPALGRFVRHLADGGIRAGSADHLVSEALYLQDPDGLGIEVYADRPRAEWRSQGLELRMTTDPLDLRSVAAAAGDERWTGLPVGTTIGHVHLHVGSLPEAEAFYHHALGFDKVVWSYPGALFLSAGGYHHHLGTNTWAASARPASDGDARLLEWEIVLPSAADVERAAAHLARSGHDVSGQGTSRLVADPWGTSARVTS